MGSWLSIVPSFAFGAVSAMAAERINHAERLLGPPPAVTNAILFNTQQADAMIAQISADLPASRRTLRAFKEMNFVLAPDNQPLLPVTFTLYGSEFDPSPFPTTTSMPIETWPSETGALTLTQWQQDKHNIAGDRHAMIVQPGSGAFSPVHM
jgi:hypothetical protein